MIVDIAQERGLDVGQETLPVLLQQIRQHVSLRPQFLAQNRDRPISRFHSLQTTNKGQKR
jgi:hypothetical protein